MGRMSRLGRIAALVVGLALCVAVVAAPSTGLAVTIATVQGTVTNSAAAPLPGMHVVVAGVNLTLPFWGDAVTDPLGGYAVGVPEAGDYNVTVEDPDGEYLINMRLVPSVTAGTVITDFTMQRPGAFSGTVTDSLSSAPVQLIEVQSNLLMPGYEVWDGIALTDQYGDYSMTGVYPGPHAVYFYDGSGRPTPYAPQWYNGATLFSAATTVTVVEDGNTPDIDAELSTDSVLGGRVTDAVRGIPLGSTIITIQNDNTADMVWTSTSADGTYRIAGLPAGDYTIAALTPQDDWVNFSQMVTLLDNQVLTNVDFAMTPAVAGYMDSHVTDGAASPLGGIEVSLAMGLPSANGPVEFSTVTTASGGFLLPPRTGQITLRFFDPTGAHPTLVATLVAVGPGSYSDFILGDTGTISGTVSDVNARPIAGAVALLWDAADPVAPLDSSTSGLDGGYSFGNLAAGAYKVSFNAGGYVAEWFDNQMTFANATVITVTNGPETASAILSKPDKVTASVPAGTDVTVSLLVPFNGTTRIFIFEFGQVTTPGILTITPLGSQPDWADMADGYRIVGGFYDVSFSGVFTGPVEVTMPYDNRLPNFRALTLKLLHWLSDSSPDVVDVTTNTSIHRVTFTLAALSPIVLAEPDTNSMATNLSASWRGTSATLVSPAYGGGVYIQGRLRASNGSALYSGAAVNVQKLVGGVWQNVGPATRSSSGLYSRRVTATTYTVFRLSFGGDPLNAASVSRELKVKPHVRISLNSLRTRYREDVPFTVTGKIAPGHTPGGTTTAYVKIYKYIRGRYRFIKTVAATIGSAGTTFSATLNLKSAGRWRLVPYAPMDAAHNATNGRSRYTRSY